MELDGAGFYIAPPDRHMRIEGTRIQLDPGPRENGHRPAIDPLFRSAADSFGERAAGVILSGTLDDGTVGLFCIKEAGGTALAQDPLDALYPAMPANAIAYARPDYVLPIEELVDTLVRLTASSPGRAGKEISVINDQAPDPSAEAAQPGELAPFACPDCGGTLWERSEGETVSYWCRVGHAFTLNSLVARHDEALERTLWAACRALEERAAMSRRVARRLDERGRSESGGRFERRATVAAGQAAELKRSRSTRSRPHPTSGWMPWPSRGDKLDAWLRLTKLDDLEALLDYIKASRGFDFTGYKRPSLQAPDRKRMQAVGSETSTTTALSRGAPGRVPELFNTILINVTSFFRDAEAWEYLRDEVVPRICSRRQAAPTSHPRLVRGLCVGRGAVHDRDGASPRRSARRLPRAREDLRDRRRRGGARRRRGTASTRAK